jgi:ABC-type nitrate/sulfonate/bicarbonate transport system ATPase subunit
MWSGRAVATTKVMHVRGPVLRRLMEAALLADRVVVLGGRPAEILGMIAIDLPQPRSPDDPAIFDYHRRIMEILT